MKIQKAILVLLLAVFSPALVLALEIGTPSGSRGAFAGWEKHFYGDYLSSGAPSDSVWSSSSAMTREVLADGTTIYFADVPVTAGNTFYYYLKTQSSSEQKTPVYRTIYVSSSSPGEVIVDGTAYPAAGLVASATIWHNFSDAPPPPANLTSFWSAANDFVSLEWDNPMIAGAAVFDLTGGGGYEIWRSSISFSDGMAIVSSVTAILSGMSFPDSSVEAGATYYYRVRAYDAYLPPMFSSYGQTSPASKRNYVTVALEVDVSALSGVTDVSVVGDFTSPPFYKGRLIMDYAGGGKWRLEHADASLYAGALIKYKYLVNGELYEPDLPPALGGPYRNVAIKDEGSRRMTLKDVWSVWTPTGTPSNLPQFMTAFSAEPSAGAVKITWDCDPFSTGTLLGYAIERSSSAAGGYSVISSTDILGPATFHYSDALADGSTAFYRIAAVFSSGQWSEFSDAVHASPPSVGESLPRYNPAAQEVFAAGDFTCDIGNRTGEVILKWNAASRDAVYGAASAYVVKYATFPITGADSFHRAKTAGAGRGLPSGASGRLATLNLGGDCPGYYFAVGAVYGSWHIVGFSTSVAATAPKAFGAKDGGLVVKTLRIAGSSPDAPSVASMEFPPGALQQGEYLGVIKNLGELRFSEAFAAKIDAANSLAARDNRFGYVADNENLASSSVFAFDLYDSAKNDYFNTAAGRKTRKDIIVSLSYAGLAAAPEELKVARLNEKNDFWRVLKDVKPEIDRDAKLIKFKTRELSVYALFRAPAPADDLSNVAVYPNPFKPHDGLRETGDYSTGIRFINLTRNADIRIYNIAGELVRYKGLNADEAGECRWDAMNDDGERVASGVYIFIAKDESVRTGRNRFIGKTGIIR